MTRTVNIHEAKTHLSRLVEQAAQGEAFIIAKAGRPMVKVVPLQPADAAPAQRRLGALAGSGRLPADIKGGFEADIDALFGTVPDGHAPRG